MHHRLLALAALLVWSLAGAVLTYDVVSTRRAVEVVVASPLCAAGCSMVPQAPVGPAAAVLATWVIVAGVAAAALVLLLVRAARDRAQERRTMAS